MTAAARPRRAKPHPCCASCGAHLYENLLGHLLCLRTRCELSRQVVGAVKVNAGGLVGVLGTEGA